MGGVDGRMKTDCGETSLQTGFFHLSETPSNDSFTTTSETPAPRRPVKRESRLASGWEEDWGW